MSCLRQAQNLGFMLAGLSFASAAWSATEGPVATLTEALRKPPTPSRLGALYQTLLHNSQQNPGQVAAFSRCSSFAFLMGQAFEKNPHDSEAFLSDAILLAGDPYMALPSLQKVQMDIDSLPLFANLKPKLKISKTFAVDDFLKKKSQLLGNPSPPLDYNHLNWHGVIDDSNRSQGKNFGYIESDYDQTGRHDHLLTQAYIYRYIKELASNTAEVVSPVILQKLKSFELHSERQEISNYLGLQSRLIQQAPQRRQAFLNSYPASKRKDLEQKLERHAIIMKNLLQTGVIEKISKHERLKDSPNFSLFRFRADRVQTSQLKLIKEKNAIENDFSSQTDLNINHNGRTLYRQLMAGNFKHPYEVEKWIFDHVCDESKLKQDKVITVSGPLGAHIPGYADGAQPVPDIGGDRSHLILALPLLPSDRCRSILKKLVPIPLILETDQNPQSI